ncbi:radical SAM protein [Thermodesulfobacteriota bacterium]
MTELSMDSLIERLNERRGARGIPWVGSLELTARCNLRCRHCYIKSPNGPPRDSAEESTTGELLDILDQIADEGCLWLQLTGGEAFLRPDFFEIYDHAKMKGFIITLFSNGTTITPRIARYLAELPPKSVEITVYGFSQTVYEEITGVRGSHKRCFQGIELLMKHDVPFKLKTVVMTKNRDELAKIRAYAEELGQDFYYDSVISCRLDGDPEPTRLRISPKEVVGLESDDHKISEEWRRFFTQDEMIPMPDQYVYQCGAGRSYFHIDAFGRLMPCLMVRHAGYDLRTGTFREGWHDFMASFLEQKTSRDSKCHTCRLRASCNQCPGLAKIEVGHEEEPVAYVCELAHLRVRAFSDRPVEERDSGNV